MKTNLFKRTLSFAIVACMLIAMVAVAPMASAATVSPLTFGMDVYEYDNKGVAEIRVSVYMTGYDEWNLDEVGVDSIQFEVAFDNSKVTFLTSLAGGAPYKGLSTNDFQINASGKDNADVANTKGSVSFMALGIEKEDEETGDTLPGYIAQGAKVYFRTYTFVLKEGATGDCNFTFLFDNFILVDGWNNQTYLMKYDLPEGWVANNGVYTVPSAAPVEYTISYNANGGVGTMENTVGEAPVVAANAFVKAGYTFAGWVDAEGNAVEVGATLAADTVLTATWTANKTTEITTVYEVIGAQARAASDEKVAGMRFGVKLGALVEGVVVEEKGILMMPTDLLNGELTHNTANVATGRFDASIDTEDGSVYTAVLVGIPAGQEARPITVRGYVKVNGNYYYTSAMERNYADVLASLEDAMQ